MHKEFTNPRQRLIFALDYPLLEDARAAIEKVREHIGVLKIGLELFVGHGPAAMALGRDSQLDVFLDLKLHDIPATVARAVARAAELGARYLTVHASGGEAMLRAAVEQAAQAPTPLHVVAVTVLTSLDTSDLSAQGLPSDPAEQALRLAKNAWKAGVRSFVCSPREANALRNTLGAEARIITPGIRLAGSGTQDQKRVQTPSAAIAAGADMLVIGRPIRDSPDPALAAKQIRDEIARAVDAQPQAQQ